MKSPRNGRIGVAGTPIGRSGADFRPGAILCFRPREFAAGSADFCSADREFFAVVSVLHIYNQKIAAKWADRGGWHFDQAFWRGFRGIFCPRADYLISPPFSWVTP
jgi:hypothetical protein